MVGKRGMPWVDCLAACLVEYLVAKMAQSQAVHSAAKMVRRLAA